MMLPLKLARSWSFSVFGPAVIWIAFSSCALYGQTGSPPSQGNTAGVKRIEIESSRWGGRKVIRQKMTIRATKTGYVAGGRAIDEGAIRELLIALGAPPRQLGLDSLRIDRDWLGVHGFNDEGQFLEIVREYYDETIVLDVDAEFTLRLVRANGSKVYVRSYESHVFMVPWRITSETGEFETFDVSVSQAIAKLLPAGFLNRLLIVGTPHGLEFAEEIGALSAERR